MTQRGSWVPWLDETFGVQSQVALRPGRQRRKGQGHFTFVEDLGELSAGGQLNFHVAGSEGSRAFLPVEPSGAK